MDLSFYPLTLEALDQANAQANAEALCLFVGEDERPLVGLAGLCDWRLSGALSRMLRRGLVKGEEGEALLTPGLRLGFRKLFLFGMGPVGQAEDELALRLAERLRRLGRAGVEDAAFQIPQRLSLDTGIRTLIDEPNGPLRARVFGADPAAMVRALSSAASRGASEARHERRVIKMPASHNAQPPPGRKGNQPRPGLLEIPKAAQLPFATPQPRPAAEKSALERSLAEKPAIPEVATTAAPLHVETSLLEEEPPIAPSASEPPEVDVPIAPPADPTPLPPRTAEPVPTTTQPTITKSAESVDPQSAPARSLPVDYKAPRFVPPEPKPGGGGKKNRKKKR